MFDASRLGDVPPGPVLMAGLGEVDACALDETRALAYAGAMERMKSFCDAQRFDALAAFAQANTTVPDAFVAGGARLAQIGGAGTPAVDEFCLCEYAAAAHVSECTARAHLAVALDLRHRLPRVLEALREGLIPGWRARLVADETRALSPAQAQLAESRIMPILTGLGNRRLVELVRQVVLDTDPDAAQRDAEAAQQRRHVSLDPEDDHGLVSGGFTADAADALRFKAAVDRIAEWLATLGDDDPAHVRRAKALGYLANPHAALDLMRRATGTNVATGVTGLADDATRPTAGNAQPAGPWPEATLYVHLTRDQWRGHRDGAATLEGVGPITLTQARHVLAHANVTIRPVIDLDHMPTSDARFARGRLREALVLKHPHCPFPYCTHRARRQADHVIPYPHGPTEMANLTLPDTKHHRAKTLAGWQLAQPYNGIHVWQSPQGHVYLVDRRGVTHDLGLPPTG